MATRKKNTSAAVAALVETATAKAAAIVVGAEMRAVDTIRVATLDALRKAHDVETAAGVKASGMRAVAMTALIDDGRKAGLDGGEIKDLGGEVLAAAVAAGTITASTAKSYAICISFAVDRHIPWSGDLVSPEGREKALKAAGKKVPASIADAAEKAREKAREKAARAARPSVGHVASIESIVRHLAKALADARTLGKDIVAMDILDVIHSIKPEFTEPKPE